jgi:hypothetical protein
VKNRFIYSVFVVFLVVTLPQKTLHAAVEIRQFFPQQPVLLGQSVFWSVKLHYPMNESYSLQLQAPVGIQMETAMRNVYEESGGMSVLYFIRLVPLELHVAEAPSVVVVDQKGQSAVLTGKPLHIASISGSSLEIREPGKPVFHSVTSTRTQSWTLILSLLLLVLLIVMQYRARTPRAKLMRSLQKSLKEIRRGRLPFSLWSMLRSPLLWGFPAESRTGLELKEAAGANARLASVAELLASMERARYAGRTVQPEKGSEQCVLAAIEWLKIRRSAP